MPPTCGLKGLGDPLEGIPHGFSAMAQSWALFDSRSDHLRRVHTALQDSEWTLPLAHPGQKGAHRWDYASIRFPNKPHKKDAILGDKYEWSHPKKSQARIKSEKRVLFASGKVILVGLNINSMIPPQN